MVYFCIKITPVIMYISKHAVYAHTCNYCQRAYTIVLKRGGARSARAILFTFPPTNSFSLLSSLRKGSCSCFSLLCEMPRLYGTKKDFGLQNEAGVSLPVLHESASPAKTSKTSYRSTMPAYDVQRHEGGRGHHGGFDLGGAPAGRGSGARQSSEGHTEKAVGRADNKKDETEKKGWFGKRSTKKKKARVPVSVIDEVAEASQPSPILQVRSSGGGGGGGGGERENDQFGRRRPEPEEPEDQELRMQLSYDAPVDITKSKTSTTTQIRGFRCTANDGHQFIHARMVLGMGKGVLFRDVSSVQGYPHS